MPRQSAADRSGALYRAGVLPPEPPARLDQEAAQIWRDVVASKPVDRFDAGACVLLEEFCQAAVHTRALNRKITALRKRHDWFELDAFERRAVRATARLTMLATKLRLSIQAAVDRRSRALDEKGPGAAADDPLLGGSAVHGRRTTN